MIQSSSNDYFKELVWDGIIEGSIQLFFKALPGFAWPPIAIPIKWILIQFTEQIYLMLSTRFDLRRLVFKNKETENKFVKDMIELQAIAARNGTDSKEFIDARNESKNALSEFVMYDYARKLSDQTKSPTEAKP